MNSYRVFRFSVAASTLMLLPAACDRPQGPLGPVNAPLRDVFVGAECASTSWMTASGYIGSEGGTLTVPGASVVFPPGALSSTLDVSFTIGPVSEDSVAVMLSARDAGAVEFGAPATVTLTFGECASGTESAGGSGLLGTETTDGFPPDGSSDTPPEPALPDEATDDPPTPKQVVLAIQSFAWFIVAH